MTKIKHVYLSIAQTAVDSRATLAKLIVTLIWRLWRHRTLRGSELLRFQIEHLDKHSHTQSFALGCIWEFSLLPKDTFILTAGVVGWTADPQMWLQPAYDIVSE